MKDLRLPTGLLFAVLGLVLLGYSVTDVNINLWSGLSLGCFGGVLLWLARRAS
jgi:hypothetical protein